jgi:hypothetical protein
VNAARHVLKAQVEVSNGHMSRICNSTSAAGERHAAKWHARHVSTVMAGRGQIMAEDVRRSGLPYLIVKREAASTVGTRGTKG